MKIVVLLISFLWSAMLFAQGQDATRLLREDDPAYKKEREEWIRGMHRAEPGLNTDLVDGIARQAKAEYKMSLLRSQTPQGFKRYSRRRKSARRLERTRGE
jgi:hypothetical protein